MQDLDPDGCFRLLSAVARQWLKDAAGNHSELAQLAIWLGLDLAELQARMNPARPVPVAGGLVCPICGGPLPAPGKRGKLARYCGSTCRSQASRLRKRAGYVVE